MNNKSKNCPYCGSVHVRQNPKKMISDKKKFILFNGMYFLLLIFLCCKAGRTEELSSIIPAGIIGESVGILILYLLKKKTFFCDDCKSEFK